MRDGILYFQLNGAFSFQISMFIFEKTRHKIFASHLWFEDGDIHELVVQYTMSKVLESLVARGRRVWKFREQVCFLFF